MDSEVNSGQWSSGEKRLAESEPLWRQIAEFLLVAFLVVLVMASIRHFVVQRFYIPSASMSSTLEPGDYVLASRLTPKPFAVERGDVVIFNDSGHWLGEPEELSSPLWEKSLVWLGLRNDRAHQQLIKRVIGLPGDRVKCCDAQGRVSVNGVSINEPYVRSGEAPSTIPFDITIPAGRLWVMGDNRGYSADSRLHRDKPGDGSIPESDVLGKAIAVAWPWDRMHWLRSYSNVFDAVPPASSGS